MAVSAFKSSTRRGRDPTPSSSAGREPTQPEKRPAPVRRSRSVSAFSRSAEVVPEFLYKRDNPLFCSGGGGGGGETSPKEVNGSAAVSKKLNADSRWGKAEPNRISGPKPVGANGGAGGLGDDRRGRPASRNTAKRLEIGRSVSRGRIRSVSQRPVSRGHFASSESEVESDTSSLKNHTIRISSGLTGNMESVDPAQAKPLRKWSSQHPLDPSTDSASRSRPEFSRWEDGLTANHLSEAEETIKAFCEQMTSVGGETPGEPTKATSIYETVRSEVRQAISDIRSELQSTLRRNDSTAIVSMDVVDIPPDLVNPGAVELVMDIRSEYAEKLEQSRERARKLRADLDVEEHRGEELSRILKEILPEPKASNSQKPRPARKASFERRKMSKLLTEEAMAYFDECVSLSTFDSSDFSSPEDPPLKLVGDTKPVFSGNESVPEANSAIAATCDVNNLFSSCQEPHKDDRVDPSDAHLSPGMAKHNFHSLEPGSSGSTNAGRRSQFSISGRPNSYSNLQQDIRKYIKTLETDPVKENQVLSSSNSSKYEADEYQTHASMQSLLFDKVMHKRRVESGSMLFCAGGLALIEFSPLGSTI